MSDELSSGVRGLARTLRMFQQEHCFDVVSAGMNLPDGHTIQVRWAGDALELEREDGGWMLLDCEGVR